MTADLFESTGERQPAQEKIAEGALLLRGFAGAFDHDLVRSLRDIIVQAPFRRMRTPGGHQMSVAMTNCGDFGWVTDRSGYRYHAVDPLSGRAWPPMPRFFCSSPHGLPSARISPDFGPMSA